ncbi:MAG: hypothetical protein JWM34_4372 [Ilumatobacteraceae bacterium]|nr:hypothetical protein [Ilumatobacteraceae bacterium]
MNAHTTTPHRSASQLISAAAALTAGAAALAWLLASVAHLTEHVVVITVMVVAFLASWMVTNRRPSGDHRANSTHRIDGHRVTLVPVRVHSH